MDVGGGGGGGGAAVTFLCKTSWKNSIVFSKALTFRNHAKYKKENNLIQTLHQFIPVPRETSMHMTFLRDTIDM